MASTEQQQITVSAPQEEILQSTSDRNLFLAGVGSGKTHLDGLISSEYIVGFPEVRGFIGANTYDQLSKATLNNIFKVWNETFGWVEDVDYVVDKIPPTHFKRHGPKLKSYNNTISFDNGCMVYTASLDNYKPIDGVEFCWGILDETKDTREEAVKEVIIERMRQPGIWVCEDVLYNVEERAAMVKAGKWKEIKEETGAVRTIDAKGKAQIKGFNPLYISTSPAKVLWLNEWFNLTDKYEEITKRIYSKTDYYSNTTDRLKVVISSTYHNEANLSEGYIDRVIADLEHDQDKVNMLVYGSPIGKTGGEWWRRFSREEHVVECEYVPDMPVHLTWDFNVVPYMTLLVGQIIEADGYYIDRTLQEYCLGNPQNNTEDVCLEFLYDWGDKIEHLFYYGDPSGKNRDTRHKKRRHDFDIIEEILYRYIGAHSDRVPKSHPPLETCRDFCNKLMAGNAGVKVEIHPRCKNLITDMEFLKEGPTGGYIKPKVKDSVTGQSYEKLGHCADAWRYQRVEAFPHIFDKS